MPKVLPEYLEHRRKQILDAASACFYRSGFHQTSMSDICEAADLSPGAVYRYFRSKEDIIAAICDDSHSRNLAVIESIKAQGTAEEVVHQLGRAFLFELDPEEVRLTVDLLAEAPRSPHVREVIQAGMRAIFASFSEYIRNGQAAGEIDPNLDPDLVARVMCALYHGFIVQKHVDPDLTADGYFDTIFALVGPGLFVRDTLQTRPPLAQRH